jgi:selenocysteine-specific elongation factor
METIVGTAGHIDHGKTALVKALTGVDADRLPEEKRRGITIDIGFAEMTVGDSHFGFVDVPGHERFVKNMLAGASGIGLVLLVVAADEGIMPQTREHFDICRLLGITSGLVALTKSDLVDDDTLDIARLDVAELVASSFLEDAPVVAVSSKTNRGIDELRDALVAQARASARAISDRDTHVARLPIDRSFSMKGFGAVVTGTLASGSINEGDELDLLPNGTRVRVRGLQSHGRKVTRVTSGRRVAVNLGGIDHNNIGRGMTLVEPNALRSTQAVDAEVEVLASAPRSLRSRQRVRVHIGTAEALARVQVLNDQAEIATGHKDLVQLRLETPIVAIPGERFIVRSYSPQTTVAGGVVIDNAPGRHRRKEVNSIRAFLHSVSRATADVAVTVMHLVEASTTSGLTIAELQSKTGIRKQVLEQALAVHINDETIVALAGRYIAAAPFAEITSTVKNEIAEFHKNEPLAKGMPLELLRERAFAFLPAEVADAVLAEAVSEGTLFLDKDSVRLTSHAAELSPAEKAASDKILHALSKAGLEVAKIDEIVAAAIAGTKFTAAEGKTFAQQLIDSGQLAKVSPEFCFSKPVIDDLRGKLKAFADTTPDRLIDVPKFKEIAGVSRKYAIPLLEYFDREHVTARAGDKRVIL